MRKKYVNTTCEGIPQDLRYLDRLSFANLYQWAGKSGNSKVAHFARAHELAIEHAQSEVAEKPFFFLWRFLADYGLSFWRPMMFLFVVSMLFYFTLFCSGTTLGLPEENYTGWKAALIGPELPAQNYRALVGAAENVLSPLSLFSGRRLVVPEQGWTTGLQIIFGYASLGLIFLFGFAVRRRFKV